jgi:CelD/BcsL family acetyltransferase involved in cellulose biosynthesis
MSAQPIQVSWIESMPVLRAWERSWRELHEASGAGPFMHWAWMNGAWSVLHPQRTPRVAVARDASGACVGLLPLSEERLSGGLKVWRFAADQTVGSDYLDGMVRPGREPGCLRALWKAVHERQGDFDRLELLDLPRESPSVGMLGELFPGADTEPRYRCPLIECAGPFDAYLASRPRCDNLLRRRRWFLAQPGYAIELASRPEQVAAALDDFFRLHRLRWAVDGGSQGITSPDIEAFHRCVVPVLASEGKARIYSLRLGPDVLASVYMLSDGPRRYFYQSGYDPAWGNRSPGLVLLARTIEDAFAEGAQSYDFLRGEEAYKKEWATAERSTVSVTAAGHTLPALLYDTRIRAVRNAKSALRTLLPRDWVQEIQRRRRSASAAKGKGATEDGAST